MSDTLQDKKSSHIKNLFFDPNNYRFIDDSRYKKVDDDDVLDEKVQQRTHTFIAGKNRSNIKDLLSSFRSNGYIPVDKIQVKNLGNNNYLVLEGNRRLATLKSLHEDYEDGLDIGQLNPSIFKSIPVEFHDEEKAQTHMLVMGLKHIGGTKKWPAINRAKFIADYMGTFQGNYDEAEEATCNTLGISKQKLRQSLRTLSLINLYKDSDYGDQFENDMYSLFEEIVKRPVVRDWINWDNDSNTLIGNRTNADRLFSWLSTKEETYYDDDDFHIDDDIKRLPIITKAHEIRDLAIFIDEEDAIFEMEETGRIDLGLLASSNKDKLNIRANIERAKKDLNNIISYRHAINNDDIEDLEQVYNELSLLLPKKSNIDIEKDPNIDVCFEIGKNAHFSKLDIKAYKIFENFEIKKLNKINIFAGLNNTGKTSILEAIYILTKQNDLGSFFDIIKLKNKIDDLSPIWIKHALHEKINIEGVFNDINTGVTLESMESSRIDKQDYITSIKVSSFIDDSRHESHVDLYEYSDLNLYYEKIKILCNSMFKSPFFYKSTDLFLSHKESVEKKAFSEVMNFLRHIDPKIIDIDLTDDFGIKRFLVDSEKFKENRVDLTSYGEGLQRVFEIALSFAYSKNGVVVIDEIETAIHYALLIEFTKFIQELADKFNVQVFVTSHSKECIDAFVNNNYANNEISAYLLENRDGKISYKFSDGDRLARLVINRNIDIRGEK